MSGCLRHRPRSSRQQRVVFIDVATPAGFAAILRNMPKCVYVTLDRDRWHTYLALGGCSRVRCQGQEATSYTCYNHSATHFDVEASPFLPKAIFKSGHRKCKAAYVRKPLQRQNRRCCMAIVPPAAHVRVWFQSCSRRDRLASVDSAAPVRVVFRPSDRRGRVAGVAPVTDVRRYF